ncbi:hypothetical protein [Marinomonas sp. 2405UD68-3]|uniref:hypothetical protein n=1 Tax=Marinomonas sp. 2405UD68-3 TaxID=3391835 RepID=UPI0039C9EDD7
MSHTLQSIAEQYLDEILEAESKLNYSLFIKRFEQKDVTNFGESKFKKDMYAIREDLGEYQDREYLGALKGINNIDYPDRHPNCVRHVWKGIFEKNETVIIVGIHEKDGVHYVNECMYH